MPSRMAKLLLILCFCLTNYGCNTAMSTTREEDLELEAQLQSLNKPPVKTIQLEEGDIIDCVDMYKQPAFDNPLLKNHKIQLRPTSFPAQMKISAPVTDPISETWSKREACPDGTVPLHRTTKDDLIRAKNLAHQMFRNTGNTNPLPWNIHVSPSINGDQLPRLYTYWTVNNGKLGCFNLLCAAFVQIDRTFTPKMPLSPVSTISGPSYDMKFTIYQDTQTSNWWLAVTDRNITVGYWPKEMLPHLRNGAGEVGWGGTAMAATKRSPPIGSGQYPDDNYDHATYFRNLHFMRGWLKEVVPSETDPVYEYIGQSGCYGLENGKDTKVEFWGYRFAYGGPGGECGP